MPDYDIIGSTIRAGVEVEEIEFAVPEAPPAQGYLLGHHGDWNQRVVLGLHDERGDKASLLPELEHLAAHGFLCLGIDSPITRRASAGRDPLTAFESQLAIATAALTMLNQSTGDDTPRAAVFGRGIGGEVAACLAPNFANVSVVVATGALLDHGEFVRSSTHPLAAGMRQFNNDETVARQIAGLEPYGMIQQIETSSGTNWLLQIADDDDRYDAENRATLSLGIPRTVRVDHVANSRDLGSRPALRTRVDFISQLC